MNSSMLPLLANGHVLSRTDEVEVRLIGKFQIPIVRGLADHCLVCDEPPIFEITDDSVRVENPCPLPDGITTEIILRVPSGKIVVSDSLGPVYSWASTDGIGDYGTIRGQARAIEAMAAQGCAYGPVRNSCPNFYRTRTNSFIVARPDYDDDDNPTRPDSDLLAHICTDLWAYSIADFEDWKSRGGDLSRLERYGTTIVDIGPGDYRFTHHTGERSFDHDAYGAVVFAHIERVS